MNENKIKINSNLLDETKFHLVNKLLRSFSNGKEYSIIIHDLDSLKIMTHEELLYFCYTFLHIQQHSVYYTFGAAVLVIKYFYPDYCSIPDFSDRHMCIRLETLANASYPVTKIYNEMLREIEKEKDKQNNAEIIKNF